MPDAAMQVGPRVELTEEQVGLIRICLQIGREQFEALAATSMASRVCQQFGAQAAQAEQLLTQFAEADAVFLSVPA